MAEAGDTGRGIYIQSDVRRGRVTVSGEFLAGVESRLRILEIGAEPVQCSGEARLDLENATSWSLQTPTLYTLRCETLDGAEVVDTVDCRFGMREYTVKDGYFALNQRPIPLHGISLGLEALRGGESEGGAAEVLGRIKGAGFNGVRVEADADLEPLLEAADEAGILVHVALDAAEMQSDLNCRASAWRNHPSLAGWIVRGVGEESLHTIRAFDPSRLMLMEEEVGDNGFGIIWYARPYREKLEAIHDLSIAFGRPLHRFAEHYLKGIGRAEARPVLVELSCGGCGGLSGEAETESPAVSVVAGERGDLEAARHLDETALQFQVDALRSNTKVSGYFLSDAGWDLGAGIRGREGAGDRLDAVAKIQSPIRPLIHMPKRNLVPREETAVSVVLANEERLEGRAELSLLVVGPTNQVLWKKKRGAKIPKGGRELWAGTISASGSTGVHRFVVRLIYEMRCIAESSVEFHVLDPVDAWEGEIGILDPQDRWTTSCRALVNGISFQAPVHIIPPVANTIRAYPENELAQVIGQVNEGAVAIFVCPPDDWNDLASIIDEDIGATSVSPYGGAGPILHVAKLHPVFDGLPAGSVLGMPYRNLLPTRVFVETGEEEICTCVRDAGDGEGIGIVGNDFLVRRYGSGRLVFTHAEFLEHLGVDPVADRLFVNLARHFSRRSVQSGGSLPIHQRMVEWLRTERLEHTRRWMVAGPFSNWDGEGGETAYPPEETFDLKATYPGWYRAVRWRPWSTRSADGHWLDLEEAVGRLNLLDGRGVYGTVYAHSECTSDRRRESSLSFRGEGAVKIWLNGRQVFAQEGARAPDEGDGTAEIHLKQGRNTILVKQSVLRGRAGFKFDVAPDPEGDAVRWMT